MGNETLWCLGCCDDELSPGKNFIVRKELFHSRSQRIALKICFLKSGCYTQQPERHSSFQYDIWRTLGCNLIKSYLNLGLEIKSYE